MKKLLFITAAVAAIIAYDHVNNGNTFPSEVYCLMGAGTLWNRETRVPFRDYYDRLTAYITTPATHICIHRSLWKGWLSSAATMDDPRGAIHRARRGESMGGNKLTDAYLEAQERTTRQRAIRASSRMLSLLRAAHPEGGNRDMMLRRLRPWEARVS